MAYPRDKPMFNNRIVVDACRPFERRDTFPLVVEAGPALKKTVIDKWKNLLPEIAD
jgi:4-hydroxy-3-polyprenylbenzoate decarboxylase